MADESTVGRMVDEGIKLCCRLALTSAVRDASPSASDFRPDAQSRQAPFYYQMAHKCNLGVATLFTVTFSAMSYPGYRSTQCADRYRSIKVLSHFPRLCCGRKML